LRVIIVVVQIGAVKIYVAAVEALKEKGKTDETQAHFRLGSKIQSLRNRFALLI
jgi:hypothetical protein